MAKYSVASTKDNLSALIDKARAGEDVVITRRGKAAAKLVGIDSRKLHNRRAATELLQQRMAQIPSLTIPLTQFYNWLYEDDET